MKSPASLLPVVLGLALLSGASLSAATIAGTGGTFDPAFGSDVSVNFIPTAPGIIGINVDSTGSNTANNSSWTLTAQGGAAANVLGLGVTASGAQTSISSNSLQFTSSSPASSSLLGALGIGTSVQYAWAAQSNFGASYAPNSEYTLSFHVDGNSGLLNSVLGINPTFNVAFVDGSGNPLALQGGSNLIDLVGLLGGSPTGDVTLKFDTGAVVPTGPISVKFTGSATLGASAVGIGNDFATVNGLNLSVDPVPEPASAILVMVCGVCVMLRRRRILAA